MINSRAPHRNHSNSAKHNLLKTGIVALVAGSLAGCAFTQNSDIQNPLVRKASWFSYLNADDLRIACSAGEAEGRIRIVYNADYYDEVRVFELDPHAGYREFDLISRVFGPLQVKNINVEVNAPLGAFSGAETIDQIDRDAYIEITDALQAEGFGTQKRDGLRLYSDDYYWVAIGCSSQNITLAAWASGVDDMRALDFPAVLEEKSSIEEPLPEAPAADQARSQGAAQIAYTQNKDSGTFYRTVRGNMLR